MSEIQSDDLTELPFGLPGRVYRSPMPLSGFDREKTLLAQYQQAGVQTVVMLISDEEAQRKTGRDLRAEYRQLGLEVIYLPIPDYKVPDIDLLRQGINRALVQARAGRTLVVHCHAGLGRTGLFLACMVRQVQGFSGRQAIDWVRQYVVCAVENDDQERMVEEYIC